MLTESTLYRFIPYITIFMLDIFVAFKGVEAEWVKGCASLVRPIGHAGLFVVFVIMACMGNSIGEIVCSLMAIGFSILKVVATEDSGDTIFLLLVNGMHLLGRSYKFEAVSLALLLLMMPIHREIEVPDLFAHTGHIILMSTPGCVTHSLSFVLSCLIVLAFVTFHPLLCEMQYSALSLVIVPLCTFVHKFRSRSHVSEEWIDRTLWMCKFGPWTTISFVAYGISLFCAYVSCTDHDVVLHALHVGGILVTVIFIFPQVDARCAKYFKFIICFAAISDGVLCGARVFVHAYSICDILRAFFAFTCTLGVATIDAANTEPSLIQNEPIKRSGVITVLQFIIALFYIIASFFMYINIDDVVQSFAHIVHVCFIIGGLAIEAIYSKDKLITRIVLTLLMSETIANSYDLYGSGLHANRMMLLLRIGKSVLLAVSLPQNTHSQKGIMSFHAVK